MDAIQKKYERAVGDQFIAWFNCERGTAYEFVDRAGVAPDLTYRDRDAVLRLELTEAFYDAHDARMKWQQLRQHPNAPRFWAGVEPDEALARDIAARVSKKSINDYGANCLLVVTVDPTVTSIADLDRVLPTVKIPE